MFDSIFELGSTILDKFFVDAGEKERIEISKQEMKLKLQEMVQKGEFKTLQQQMLVMVEEARSKDKWTSRARPSFLYVMYIVIMMAFPMGIITAVSPETATHLTEGVNAWLHAMPKDLWYLFGAGYLGYSGARSFDKNKKMSTVDRLATKYDFDSKLIPRI